MVVLGETLMRAGSRSLPRGAAINQQTTLMQPVSCIVLDALYHPAKAYVWPTNRAVPFRNTG